MKIEFLQHNTLFLPFILIQILYSKPLRWYQIADVLKYHLIIAAQKISLKIKEFSIQKTQPFSRYHKILVFVVNIRTYENKDEMNKEEMSTMMEKEIGKKFFRILLPL